MPDVIVTDRVCTMELSKVFSEGEYIVQTIAEVGIPPVIITNKKIYKTLFGSGINIKTGKRYDIPTQVVEVFNFSVDHPIFQSTYKVVQHNNKQELKILSYAIMEEFNSILNIYNYLYDNWEKINISFSTNRSEYESLSKTLPQIPFLKEYFDAFLLKQRI